MMTPEQANGLAMFLIEAVARESETTRKVLAAVPDDQLDFKLGDKGRTARELMWHIATSDFWFADSIAKGEFPMEGEPAAPASKAEILAFYDSKVPGSFDALRALRPEQFLETVNFFDVFNLPRVMYLNFMQVHAVHHRGQLSTYLRAMNGHVPSIYGGSADEPFQMPATA